MDGTPEEGFIYPSKPIWDDGKIVVLEYKDPDDPDYYLDFIMEYSDQGDYTGLIVTQGDQAYEHTLDVIDASKTPENI